MAESANSGCFIVIATFMAKSNHGQIKEISGMAVNSQWIPFENYPELAAIDHAMDQGFTKCMRYNLGPREFIPNFLLTDMAIPMSVYTPEVNRDDEAAGILLQRAKDGPYPAHIIWSGDKDRRLPTIAQAAG